MTGKNYLICKFKTMHTSENLIEQGIIESYPQLNMEYVWLKFTASKNDPTMPSQSMKILMLADEAYSLQLEENTCRAFAPFFDIVKNHSVKHRHYGERLPLPAPIISNWSEMPLVYDFSPKDLEMNMNRARFY